MARTKWTEELDAKLKTLGSDGLTAVEIAAVMDLSEGPVRSRAAHLKVSLDGSDHYDLHRFVAAGGALIREDIGGVIGVRWGRAHRSGSPFDTDMCERLLTLGALAPIEPTRPVYSLAGGRP